MGAFQGAAVGAITGGITGAVVGGVTEYIATGSTEGVLKAAENGMADGMMGGTFTGAITGGLTSAYCFTAGTGVLTVEGLTAIEEIKEGDKVWSWDERSGKKQLKEVLQTYINEASELIHVTVASEEIVTTPHHPFYSPRKGWTEAVKLRAGDILVLVNGEYAVVEAIQHEILEAPVKVYNLNVQDYHTYYVTGSGVLVHNACHGNSLNTDKKTELYVLRDDTTGTVKKIGETTRGIKRYTKKYYNEKHVYMDRVLSGSKRAMHYQQYRWLKNHLDKAGKLPEYNNSLW